MTLGVENMTLEAQGSMQTYFQTMMLMMMMMMMMVMMMMMMMHIEAAKQYPRIARPWPEMASQHQLC
eukprot:12428710-Karenia_brevis.AAC.1